MLYPGTGYIPTIWKILSQNPAFVVSILMTAVGVPLFNHYVIKPHTEDKKNRLAYHHDKIREIISKWCEIKPQIQLCFVTVSKRSPLAPSPEP